MKNIRSFAASISLWVFLLLFGSCESNNDTIVGSTQDPQITNLYFHVDTTYLESSQSRLVSRGTVTNNGNSQVTSPGM